MAIVHYFRGRGRGEQLRWVLAAANVTFENRVMETHDEFLALKPQLLFGQVPMLEIDGKHIVQTQAAIRYVARRGGISGANDHDSLLADEVAEGCLDFVLACVRHPFQQDLVDSIRLIKDAAAKYCPKFEKILSDSTTGFVTSSFTYADVLLANAVDWNIELLASASFLDEFPLLARHHDETVHMPHLREYLESNKRYPLGGEVYVAHVRSVLGI